MQINAQMVKRLREDTGAGMMDCKKALQEAEGDLEKAVEHLRTKGLAAAAKKAGRAAAEGAVGSYIHAGGKIGVLVQAQGGGPDVSELAHNVCMHVAAMAPQSLNRDDLPGDVVEQEREVLRKQAEGEGKPAEIIDKMVEGRLNKFFKEVVLLEQQLVMDPDTTVAKAAQAAGAEIVAFRRLQLGVE